MESYPKWYCTLIREGWAEASRMNGAIKLPPATSHSHSLSPTKSIGPGSGRVRSLYLPSCQKPLLVFISGVKIGRHKGRDMRAARYGEAKRAD